MTPLPGAGTQALRSTWTATVGDHISALGWSPDGRVLAAAAISGPVHLLDSANGHAIAELAAHEFGTVAAVWSPAGSALATAGQDGKIRLWDPASWQCAAELDAGAPWVECLGWSRNGLCLASGAGRALRFWSDSGELIRECPQHASTITDLAWHPLRRMAAAACYGGATLWKPDAPEPAAPPLEWKGSLLALAWSPNGRMLVSGNQDESVHFWFVDGGEGLHMSGYGRKVRELAWSADSRWLATGGSNDVIVWDCSGKGPAGKRPLQLELHGAPVSQLAFQRKGALLASGCEAGTVALWRPRDGKRVLASAELGSAITCLAWAPNGLAVAAATDDGTLVILAGADTE